MKCTTPHPEEPETVISLVLAGVVPKCRCRYRLTILKDIVHPEQGPVEKRRAADHGSRDIMD